MNKWTYIALGVGIGGVVGSSVSYTVAIRKLRQAEQELEQARQLQKRAYQKGILVGSERAQNWINENVLIIDAQNPEEAQKKISQAFGESADISVISDATVTPGALLEISPTSNPLQKTPVRESEEKSDDEYAESKEQEETVGPDEIGFRFHGKLLKYPRKLFFDEDGDSLGETRVRENLRVYEDDRERLNMIWHALGYGEYYPDEPDETEPGDIDTTIDADETNNPEPEIKTKERERYIEQVKRYNDDPNAGPRIVSKREFDEECYLDKANINYYAGDNVFVESTDIEKPIDAVMLLGVSDGNYLFDHKPIFPEDEDDNDPDIVYVRNFKMHTIAEVTRFKFAYASVKDGSVYVDGSTDQNGGAGGL